MVPEACARLYALTRAGAHDEARALQRRLVPLARLLGSRYGVAGLKAALAIIGCDGRRPEAAALPGWTPRVCRR